MSSKKTILTFSGRMRSGKDSLCEAMKNAYGSVTFSMATHLKRLCCGILDNELSMLSPWNNEQLDKWKNNRGIMCPEGIPLSEKSVQLISEYTKFSLDDVHDCCDGSGFRNVRELLQIVGTDVIREIDASWHIKRVLQDISALPDGSIVCIDDIRFPNELEAFRNAGANSFFIIRTNAENVSRHDSENQLTHSDFPDGNVIINNRDISALCSDFVKDYGDNFNFTHGEPFFLSENPKYRDVNREFATEQTPLVDEVVRQNRENEIFLKDGLITFRNNTKFKLKEVLAEMSITDSYQYEQMNGRFVIDNPIAYENLKRWL